MSKVILENLTPVQAKKLAEWFEAQGEQEDLISWFQTNDVDVPTTDVFRKGGYRTTFDNGDITIYMH